MKRFLALLCVLACLCALCLPAAAFGEYTVRVKAPEGWNDVYLYMWNTLDESQPSNAAWPGEKLTNKVDGWYEVTLSNVVYDRVIVSNGSGQTKDIEVESLYDLWVTVDAGFNYGVAYTEDEAGKVDFGPEFMAIVGQNITGVPAWDPSAEAGRLVEVEDLVYEITFGLAAGTKVDFKFAGNGTWDLPFNMGGANAGETYELNKSYELTENGQDLSYTAPADMGLKVTLDLTAMANGGKATFKLEKVDNVDIPEPPAPVESTYFVAGEEGLCGTAWDCAAEANKMTKSGDGIYTLTFANIAAGTYKLKVTDGTWSNCWGDPNSGDTDGNYVLNVAEAGDVIVTFDENTKTVTAEVVPVATEPSTEATEPSTEATEPSTEATEPSTEATEPSTEVTEPVTEPSAEATEPSDEATEPEASQPSQNAPKTEKKGTSIVLIAVVIGIWVIAAALIVFVAIKKL